MEKSIRENEGSDRSRGKSLMRRWPLRAVISVTIILTGIGAAIIIKNSAPKVSRRAPVKMVPLVETEVLHSGTHRLTIPGRGLIVPAREIELKVLVSGEIIKTSPGFTVGGILPAGAEAFTIDPTDYELFLKQKELKVAEAEYALRLEQGHQDVARREWQILYGGQEVTAGESDLALRKPHLEKVEAELAAARAETAMAALALERTRVIVPFTALVKAKQADLGSRVNSQEKLAELVGVDYYWVQVLMPVDRLKWLEIPDGTEDQGSPVEVFYRDDNRRTGRVARLMAELSTEGRMAQLLVRVDDPLDLAAPAGHRRPPLLIGEYVRVAIVGNSLNGVFQIPRTALRNDSEVWLADREGKLRILPIKTIWREGDYVLVRDGLQDGDRLIVSGLATPVDGMSVKTVDEEAVAAEAVADGTTLAPAAAR